MAPPLKYKLPELDETKINQILDMIPMQRSDALYRNTIRIKHAVDYRTKIFAGEVWKDRDELFIQNKLLKLRLSEARDNLNEMTNRVYAAERSVDVFREYYEHTWECAKSLMSDVDNSILHFYNNMKSINKDKRELPDKPKFFANLPNSNLTVKELAEENIIEYTKPNINLDVKAPPEKIPEKHTSGDEEEIVGSQEQPGTDQAVLGGISRKVDPLWDDSDDNEEIVTPARKKQKRVSTS